MDPKDPVALPERWPASTRSAGGQPAVEGGVETARNGGCPSPRDESLCRGPLLLQPPRPLHRFRGVSPRRHAMQLVVGPMARFVLGGR